MIAHLWNWNWISSKLDTSWHSAQLKIAASEGQKKLQVENGGEKGVISSRQEEETEEEDDTDPSKSDDLVEEKIEGGTVSLLKVMI